MIDPGLAGRIALVTGANQGIGAATARALASHGVGVLLTFLRLDPSEHASDPAFPAAYGELRARTAEGVLAQIAATGGRAVALEADLADISTPSQLFDHAEATLGPADILVNNADAWVADTFSVFKNPEWRSCASKLCVKTAVQGRLLWARSS